MFYANCFHYLMKVRGWDKTYKRRLLRFGFDGLRTSQLQQL